MSITDAISRIEQIQSQIVQLSDAEPAPAAAAATPATAATSAPASTASASAFDSTLAAATGATGATVTPGAGQLAENGTTGAEVVADAQKYLGVPYVFGGTSSAGLDCSGLVQRVYGDLGISLPRVVQDQESIGQSVPSLADAQPGDLIVCNGGEHIVIYAGNGKIIQAPKPGGHVEEMDNWISPSNVVTIRRIVPAASSATAATDPTATGGASGVTAPATSGSATSAVLASLLTSGIDSSLADALLGSSGSSGLGALLGASGGLAGSADTGGLFGSAGTGGLFGNPSSVGLTALLAQLAAGADG